MTISKSLLQHPETDRVDETPRARSVDHWCGHYNLNACLALVQYDFFKHLCRKAFYTSIAHFFDSRRKLVDEAYKTIPQLIYEDRER